MCAADIVFVGWRAKGGEGRRATHARMKYLVSSLENGSQEGALRGSLVKFTECYLWSSYCKGHVGIIIEEARHFYHEATFFEVLRST